MKSDKLLLPIAALLFLVVVFAGLPSAQTSKKPVKIGLMYDLTGIYSPMGKDSQNAATTWLELINAKRGIEGHPVEFVALDGQSDPTKATLVAKRLIEAEEVYAIAGSNGTGVALAVGPVCEKAKIPYVTATGSEIFEYTLKPYWSFRACTTGWELVDWGFASLKLLDPKINNIAVLYQGAAFGKALYDMAVRYAPMRGLKIVAAEKYDPAGTDFGAQISALMKANPDAVCVYTADMAGPLAIKQMREMGMDKPVMTNGAINMKAIREAFKDVFSIPRYTYSAAQHADVWWQLPKDAPEYKAVASVANLYEKKYNEQYGWFQQIAINDLALIANAIERGLKADPNLLNRDLQAIRSVIRDNIETTKDLHTGGGILTVTPGNHNAVIPGTAMATFHFEKGKIVYDPELSKVKLNPPPPAPK